MYTPLIKNKGVALTLDSYQQKFIDFPVTPLSVINLQAVPGSGKSTPIVSKIDKLIKSGQFTIDEIIVTTFSNKSAADIRRKLKQLGYAGAMIGTTHKIMLNLHREYVGRSASILSEWEALIILRQILYDVGLIFHTKKEATKSARVISNYIQCYNSVYFEQGINSFCVHDTPYIEEAIVTDELFRTIYRKYDEQKREKGMFDFDDILSDRMMDLLPLDKISKRTKLVAFDECQDLSYSNYHCALTTFKGASVMLVGDVGQKIYSFRWAYSEPMTDRQFWYDRGYKKVDTLYLLNNYRSNASIVKAFNAYRKHMDGVSAIPIVPEAKGSVKFTTLNTDAGAGVFIAKEIRTLLDDGHAPKDITVLVRKSGFIKTVLEPSFIKLNIPYKVATPQYKTKFYDVPLNKFYLIMLAIYSTKDLNKISEVADCFNGIGISYRDSMVKNGFLNDDKSTILRKSAETISKLDLDDDVNSMHHLISAISDVAMEHVKHTILTEKRMAVITKTITNFASILMEEEGLTGIEEIIDEILQRVHEFDDENKDCITLTTTHQYKGLENKIIFVANANDVTYNIDESTYPVMYVALSRAIEKMYVVESIYTQNYKMSKIKMKPYPLMDRTKMDLFGGAQ